MIGAGCGSVTLGNRPADFEGASAHQKTAKRRCRSASGEDSSRLRSRTRDAENQPQGIGHRLRTASLSQEPDNAFILQDLGRLFEDCGRPREAFEAYKRIVHPSRGLSSFQSDPGFLVPYSELAERLREGQEASIAYRRVLQVFRPRPITPPQPAWDSANPARSRAEASTWVKRSQDDSLRLDLTHVRDQRERMAWVKIAQGVANSSTGDSRSALPCYVEAVRRAPGLAFAHCRLGNALKGVGRNRKADL